MGGSMSSPSVDEGVENDVDVEEDVAFEDKLIFLRNAMIQLHGQFLHFKHVQKCRNSENDEEEVKMMKVLVMVIHKGIEELKVERGTPEQFSVALSQRIDELGDVIARLMLGFDQFEDNTTSIENLMSHLNPFDVPTLETLRKGSSPMPTIFAQHTEEHERRLETIRRRRIQMEEEFEIRCDNARILHGQRRIHTLLQKPVVLFINTLSDWKTLEVMKKLNEKQVEYTIFDVSTDPEVRFIAKDLADCETFPQVFVDCEYRNQSDLDRLIDSLPKL